MNVFPFVEAEKVEGSDVAKACALLEVSRSAFYEWFKHVPSAGPMADEELAERIPRINEESRGTYGWPPGAPGAASSRRARPRKRVARIVRGKGLADRCRRRVT
jgi:hypothetical protein